MSVRSSLADVLDAALEATIVGSFTRVGYVVRSRLEAWSDPTAVTGRTVVITGATSGLGLAAATRLATLGARLHLVGRSEAKLAHAQAHVRLHSSFEVVTHCCDLSLLRETRRLAETLAALGTPIDVLIQNAGALLTDYTPTREGIETTIATHVLSPYLLTEYLLTHGGFAPRARDITVTSGGMYSECFNLATLEMTPSTYRGTVAYARAKRAQCVLIPYWQHDHGSSDVSFHLVHPGWAATPGLSSGIPRFERATKPFLRSADEGADTMVWLAGTSLEPTPGQLWLDRRPRSLYRLKKTRLNATEEVAAGVELARWCDERVTVALSD